MLWKKGKGGVIEPEEDYQYRAILESRARKKAEDQVSNLAREIEEIKRAIGIK